MPDRSAGDRSPAGDLIATGPADRLSLTVSALLIGGLLLASTSLFQNAQSDKLKPPKRPPAPVANHYAKKPSTQPSETAGVAIRLPPPPVSAGEAIDKVPAKPKRELLKPAKRVVQKPRIVQPLKRIAAARPVTEPRVSASPRIKHRIQPLKPVKPLPQPVVQPKPRPNPVPANKTPEKTHKSGPQFAKAMVDGSQNTKTGGALLRLLEHGQGPTIEIAWPRQAHVRRTLYRQLTQCYGVRAAVLVGGEKLFSASGRAGETWSINMDRYSGFIRSPQGEAIAEEMRVFASIADRHGLNDWRPVRVFPRTVDAALLGGLGAVLGPRYKSAKQIRAAYRWDRSRLILSDFIVDGRSLTGTIALPLPRGHAQGRGCD